VQNAPVFVAAISKFFMRPVLSHRAKDAGIVTSLFVLMRGNQNLSVSLTFVNGTPVIG
jgi:hypothetical protein